MEHIPHEYGNQSEAGAVCLVCGAEHTYHEYGELLEVGAVCSLCGYIHTHAVAPGDFCALCGYVSLAAAHVHPICGAGCISGSHEAVEFLPIPADFSGGMLPSGTYYLDRDILLAAPVAVAAFDVVVLCLNGHDLLTSDGTAAISAEGQLYLCDCTGKEHGEAPTGNGAWVSHAPAASSGVGEAPHTEHTYENGVCTVCGVSHTEHSYASGVCSVCGVSHTEHSYESGTCTVCGVSHTEHSYASGVCTVCGVSHTEHSYASGTCTVCGVSHTEHSYASGVCTVCGVAHTEHSYASGVCTVCGVSHTEHTYENGVCTLCAAEHTPHTFEAQNETSAKCSVCGYIHTHTIAPGSTCELCGYVSRQPAGNPFAAQTITLTDEPGGDSEQPTECTHNYQNGVCTVCNTEHTPHTFTNQTETGATCSVCGYAHTGHTFADPTAEGTTCSVCNYAHTGHTFADPTAEGATCSVCNYAHTEHTFADPTAEGATCSVCNYTHTPHSYDENNTCTVCSFAHTEHSYDANYTCTVCGYTAHYHLLGGSPVEFQPIPADFTYGDLSGSYYLDRDIDLTDSITVPAGETLNLCLNGKVLQWDTITVNGRLNLCDCGTEEHKFSESSTGLWFLDETDGTRTVTGGVIIGGGRSVVTVNADSEFVMYGGTIVGGSGKFVYGSGSFGGGVYQSGGSFIMYGGSILGNEATYGGGVYLSGGSFTMNGGTITGNTASGNGGGVNLSGGSFTMNGGIITGNTASGSGGGVYLDSGTMTLNGGSIVGNTANGAANNIQRNDGTVITLGAALADGSHFGIYGEGVFTAPCDTDHSAHFTSDSGNTILHLEDGTLSAVHVHPLCGAGCTHGSHPEMTDWQMLSAGFTGGALAGGSYYLAEDITLTAPITFASGTMVNLCLNGHVLNGGGSSAIFDMIENGVTNVVLNITDCGTTVHSFAVGANGLWVLDEASGTRSVTGGVITGGQRTVNSGAVFSLSGSTKSVNFYGGNVVGNTAPRGGVASISASASFHVYGGNFQGNTATGAGGVIDMFSGSLTIESGVTICDNTAGGNGGAIALSYGTVTTNGAVFARNVSTGGDAGAIYVTGANSTLISNNTTYTGNTAKKSGGAIFAHDSASVTINGGAFTQNKTTDPANDGNGGAIGAWDGTKLTVKGVTFTGNEGLWGGAIRTNSASVVTIENSTFTGNKAVKNSGTTGYGGALRIMGTSNAVITGCTFSGNTAARSGGAIFADSPITLTGSTITGNEAGQDGDAADGGGIRFSGTHTFSLADVTIQNNTTTTGGRGGGVFIENGTLELGGTMVIDGNTLASAANNLYILGTAAVAIAEGGLAAGSGIGYTLPDYADGTTIVTSGAVEGYEQYFFADITASEAVCYYEEYQNGGLIFRNATDHAYANGTCTACGYQHTDHDYDNGTCTVCSYLHTDHEYENYVCKVCGAAHDPHTYGDDQITCTVCGFVRQYHPLCGAECVCGGHENMEFLPIPADFTGGVLSGSYYLDRDIALTGSIEVAADTTLTLCLNGHTLTAPEGSRAITAEGTLNLTDCGTTVHKFREVTQHIDYFPAKYWELDEANGTKTVTGGMIVGGTLDASESQGGVIYVGGTMNLYGGILTGGNLTYNGYGGGVYVGGTMNLYGGSILGNKTDRVGGGVYYAGSFNMYGGSITGNKAKCGGGVGALQGIFTMHSGTISENSAYFYGGGVYVCEADGKPVFTMNGGSITGNYAPAGGGVLNWSDFTMNGGSITGNKAFGMKVGGYVYSGGGVLSDTSYSFTLSGNAVITDNYYVEGENEPKPNNIYNLGEPFITIGELTEGADIGISGEGEFANACDTDYSQYFTSDDGYTIVYTANKTLAARAGEVHHHAISGGQGNLEFLPIPAEFTGGALAGSYYLDRDIALTGSIEVAADTTLTLCLNGNVLTAPAGSRAITVNGGELNLTDCGTTVHKFTVGADGLWALSEGGTETVTGGVITGGNADNGGAIYGEYLLDIVDGRVLQCDSVIRMYGGNLVGNTAIRGGGVYSKGDSERDSTFALYGGSIVGNRAIRGGGVYALHTSMSMSGGRIARNQANGDYGGGICTINGTLALYGGEISANTAKAGGGVYYAGSFNMYGGSITGNYSGQNGGGVGSLQGTFTMYGGTISGNNANVYGGGVYVCEADGRPVFTMNGGLITGNKAPSGGGVLNFSDFIMNGGLITGNTVTGSYDIPVQTGGGVHSGGRSFTLSGNAVIKDNYYVEGESEPKPNNIYVWNGACLITVNTLTQGASFGITPREAPTAEAPVQITTNAANSSYFFSDSAAYAVETGEDGKLYLVTKSPIALDITWTQMDFTYQVGTWNPETHAYRGEGWQPTEDGYGTITVENKGSEALNVSLAFSPDSENTATAPLTGTFTLGSERLTGDLPVGLSETKTIRFTPEEEPTASISNAKLGTISVTVQAAPPNSGE